MRMQNLKEDDTKDFDLERDGAKFVDAISFLCDSPLV